jgi:hypothetical protein
MKSKGKETPVSIKHQTVKTKVGSGGTAARLLKLGIRWKSVMNLTPWTVSAKERAHGSCWVGS